MINFKKPAADMSEQEVEALLDKLYTVVKISEQWWQEYEARLRAWNMRWDSIVEHDIRMADPELDRMETKIDSWRNEAKNVLYDILFALEVFDKPLAR